MELTRRSFLKASGLALAGSMAYGLSSQSTAFALDDSGADADWKLVDTEEFTNICCYCSGGCSVVCSVRDGELINLEGDPDSPINEGGLCPKGAAMFQLRNIIDPETGKAVPNPDRVYSPKVRRPGSSDWEDISWEDAIAEIAKHVKKTRDETFIEKKDGVTVNRTEAIASLGGSQQNSEEEYAILKIMRQLGIVAIDNQARVCHSSTVAGLAPSFGRGSMTNHYRDIKNADYILHCGSNSAESHPVSFRWVTKAKENGAVHIVVDPRYTRTAATADLYCPIRPGTDIAFYGGLINYILSNDLWQRDYVMSYTNMSYLINEDYDFDVESGLFTGWDKKSGKYDQASWAYQTESETKWDTSATGAYSWAKADGVPQFTPPVLKTPKKDKTLKDKHTVYQIMKKHYSRYDLDTVCNVCGMDKETLEKVYKTYCKSGAKDKSGTILYALGQTQHTFGANNCRAMCIVQLLLGNVGIPGGGVNALRGEPNVQGATDMAMLVFDLPGYLHWPSETDTPSLRAWCEHETYSDGYYTNKPKFLVSFLKEWFGDKATVDNDYGYDWLPKVPANGADFTHIGTFERMVEGSMKGYFCWGQNPAHSAPNAKFAREAMSKLDWLVVADWYDTETSCFWKAPDLDASQIDTEVYLLPAALIYEKPGTILNSGRLLQWRYKAVEPAGDTKTDLEICDLLWRKICELYKKEGGKCSAPILNTKWDYYIDGKIDFRSVAWALNGYSTKTSDFKKEKVDLLPGFAKLQADGSTACGIWIYSGYYNNNDKPLDPASQPVGGRGQNDPGGLGVYPEWAFAWPANRHVIYNRASADVDGKPWNSKKTFVRWTGKEWQTYDVPDFVATKTDEEGNITQVEPNDKAFMMRWEQHACLFATSGIKEMPLPEHYEPYESPVQNTINGSQNSPMLQFGKDESTKRGSSDQYPIACTTYSITEHWQTGGQTRACPALNEVQPRQFCEISQELADAKGIKNGDMVRVFNERGSVKVNAMVTKRFTPLTYNGKTIHHMGIIHHWGWANIFSTGDVVNDLTPNVGDPNSFIPEYRGFLVDIEKA